MNQINLKIYHPDHLDLLELYEGENLEKLKSNTSYKLTERDEAYTVVIDNKPVFALGCRIVNSRTADCWLIRTVHTKTYKKLVVETVEKLLTVFCKDNGIKRLQTVIKEPYVRWIEFMGFERECELRGFDTEKTYLYRRLI